MSRHSFTVSREKGGVGVQSTRRMGHPARFIAGQRIVTAPPQGLKPGVILLGLRHD
jgi:hypothetical protein